MSILRKKIEISLIVFLISFNNVVLGMNKRFDKSSKGSPSIAPNIRKSDNDWHPISYNTETDHHNLENESKTKDISDKSTQFFHDITGTQSPYDKDIKSLANRGLNLIKEQELEDKYKNLKELENYNNGGAALSLKIPNNNFNKPISYGFINPLNEENEQNIEQAQHHHNYHSQHPYSHNIQHHQPQHNLHHDFDVIPYTNSNTPIQQDNYYQIPNQFAPHFEALTQARESATKSNYHNENQNQQRHETSNSPSNSYDIGIQHTFQPSNQFIPSSSQHYNENVNEYSPSNAPHNQVHIQKFPSHPSDSYSHQQLYVNNPNENSPHFEALTAEKQSSNRPVRNQSSKKKKNNKKQNHTQHYGIYHEPLSSNCDGNSCERHNSQEFSAPFSTRSPHKSHHNSKKHHHHHHHNHETPDMITLLNHKIYHDDEENLSSNSSPEDHSNHNSYQHSSHHSSKGKRSKKSKKPKRHHNKGNSNSKLTHSMHSTQHPSDQYQMSEHPNNGKSYQVFEYPQESRITERIAGPLNDTTNKQLLSKQSNILNSTPTSDIEKSKSINHQKPNKKFEGQQQHVDKEINNKNQKSRQSHNKSNKNKIKNYEDNVNATNTNNSDSKNFNTPSPEYKFLINYRDELERSDKNVHESDASKSQPTAVKKEIRYFQDIYLAKTEPKYIEMGHKIENPEYLEERFEENDRKNQQFRGSVKWVNGDGEQGQQLWDLGH